MTVSSASSYVADRFLTSGEVAVIFRVDPKTVTRWAKQGKIPCIRTPGGHRRYRQSTVLAILKSSEEGRTDSGRAPIQSDDSG